MNMILTRDHVKLDQNNNFHISVSLLEVNFQNRLCLMVSKGQFKMSCIELYLPIENY